ncbi:hypothetical protein [Endozoicomonas ascidiicola]|uniref:hypothetical protein n=1 Tax=Endozoicomonas ascidiicola TaxID=1698521 RepID=UPI00082FE76E|nr:hypothetical protein [Endozoicomonas ascidiicola]
MKTRTGRKISLSQLKPAQKRKAWQHLKARKPKVAELLQDETFQTLKEHFNGDIQVDADDVKEALYGQH